MKTSYKTTGTCAERIELDIENGIVKSVEFIDGCDGNTKGISRLLEGADARSVADKLRGIRCGRRPTSCPDQLARAIDTHPEISPSAPLV
ncbi:MAG: TIGR03905 family TSCPD domain-containing protein [Oscillospiraceae bacterium]|jgi:uncharacterized protein (TIGR03905 family)|nr:TIGR03905 family TSCPD domain-containing protein [Oscillospiraceae bacterium]